MEFKNIKPIFNAFGEDRLKMLPNLDLKNKIGSTGYIDFIKAEEMKQPVMKGIDFYHRPFIAIKLTAKKNTSACDTLDSDDSDLEGVTIVGTFFQRYTGDKNEWAYGSRYGINMLWHDSRIRKNDYISLEQRLKKIINGEIVFSTDPISFSTDTITGDGDWTLTLSSSV
jgi:hypothetical protein